VVVVAVVAVAVVMVVVVVAVVDVVHAPHMAGQASCTSAPMIVALQSAFTKSLQIDASSGIPLQLTIVVVMVVDVAVVVVAVVAVAVEDVVQASHKARHSSTTVVPNKSSVQSALLKAAHSSTSTSPSHVGGSVGSGVVVPVVVGVVTRQDSSVPSSASPTNPLRINAASSHASASAKITSLFRLHEADGASLLGGPAACASTSVNPLTTLAQSSPAKRKSRGEAQN
jgi:hypothetical protein